MGDNKVKLGKVGFTQQPFWGYGVNGTITAANYSASSPPIVDGGVTVEDKDWMSANSVAMESDRAYINKHSNLPTMSFSWTMVKSLLEDHFSALLFDKSQLGNLYTFNPEDSVVDFKGGEGELYAVVKNWAVGQPYGNAVMENSIIDTMTIAIDNKATGLGREAVASGNWVGSVVNYIPDVAYVWSTPPTTGLLSENRKWYMDFNNGFDNLTNHCYHNFNITFNNSVEAICRDSNGEAGNFRITPTITLAMSIPSTSAVDSTFRGYIDGKKATITFRNYAGTGNPSLSGDIKFTCSDVYLTATPDAPDGEYEAWNIQGSVLRPSTGWDGVVKFYV